MKVAVLKESRPGENRVALVPQGVQALAKAGLEVMVESGAGVGAGVSDEDYRSAGATVGTDGEALTGAGMVLGINPPAPEDVGRIPEGAIVVSFLSPLTSPELVSALAARRPRFLPMFTTAAGTIRPAKALILGAGVAGLQAIATARRLGAVVEAFDVRPAVKEQVQSLGAKFLETEHEVTAEGEGGYAKELSEEQHQRELQLIGAHIADADVVVTTAQIPGRRAPILITADMVKSMKPGSVIVDLAGESGGNCELTRAGETTVAHGVQILSPANLPAEIPVHASQMYSKNLVTLIGEFVDKEGNVALDLENDVVGPSTVTHGGQVVNERVKQALGL